jgi:ABC-type uncharacterized transport system auxiliary subunit
MNPSARIVVLVGLSLGLGACAGTFRSHAPAAAVYTLRAASPAAAARTVDATLVIAHPSARPGLDGDGIAVALPDRQLSSYAGSRWSAALPRLVEGLLIDGFRGAGAFRAVVTERSAFGGRYLLQVEIVEFAASYAATGALPVARVTLRGELGVGSERRLLATVTGSAAVPATADRQRDVAAAFEAAYGAAAAQLIDAVDGAVLADAPAARP